MKQVDYDLYRVFSHVAQAGSISQAAADLFVSQPAVSQSVRQLEDVLGVRLFMRTSRGVLLTKEGKELLPYVEQACGLLRKGEQRLSQLQDLVTGEIHIGASDTLCRYFLLPYLRQFHGLFPAVKIGVTNRTTQETLALLRAGQVDLGFINLPIDQTPDLEVTPVRQIQDCFVVGEELAHLSKSAMELVELAGLPLLLLEAGSNTRRFLDTVGQSQGVQFTPEIELGSVDLLVQFAIIGLGVAFVIRDFVAAELATGSLWELNLATPIPPRAIGLVTLANLTLSPAAHRLRTIVLTACSAV